MVGIEQVSTILVVAQLGILLSKVLIEYLEEAQEAPSRILRISNEIQTTSERLKEVANLVDVNQRTRLFSEEGLQSALRASTECEQVIQEVRLILRKSGYNKPIPTDCVIDKDEIDISHFTRIKWPFVKPKLAVPRAELQRIKSDLILLFITVMARRAEAVYSSGYSSSEEDSEDENDRAQFHEFKKLRVLKEEEKQLEDKALLLNIQRGEKRKMAEAERERIEVEGVAKFKEALARQKDERESRTRAFKGALEAQLSGLGLSSEQNEHILQHIRLPNDDEINSNTPNLEHDRTATPLEAGLFKAASASKFNLSPKLMWRRIMRNEIPKLPKDTKSPADLASTYDEDESISYEIWVIDSHPYEGI
ncbi:hypothetical protein AJ80_09243 [Polytolypa hystricis UAMH7299]|uniref:Fungal N-terminal domain-containing protein n=1 Tax=Polytolypa hystricis (strain UAMH7299) TaxID=1447883 RepID=A0A2B7WT76_POLH7|nr:hypothetical protein AJ80_09243 [Polytolypa hystricis UAMH7299]